MKVNTIEKVKKYIAEARKLAPEITDDLLDRDGAIYYQNGRNGTEWDFEENQHLPSFMVFGTHNGLIKVNVNSNDTMVGWVYADFGMNPTHTLPVVKLDKDEARHLASQMYCLTDLVPIYNPCIDDLDFTIDVKEIF